jgi:ATP-dependent helicase/nuclease subunit B
LLGFVDRVDFWKTDELTYYRVVDYKTGRKDFDYCDVFNGLGLQMLLYLFALEESGKTHFDEHLIGAGILYFPARAPIVSVDGRLDDEDAAGVREKLWKRQGLVLADDLVLNAMESSDSFVRLPIKRKKDGTVSGDIADRSQFKLLKSYVFALLGRMVDEIASGCVDANPYTRGGRHNACAFCPFGAVCNESAEHGRRDYAAMNAQKFWEEVEKEMNSSGRKTDT